MVKVVVGKLTGPKAKAKAGASSVTEKRVRNTIGQIKTLRTLDTGSQTFGADLQYVFGKNVAKARRDNKKSIGVRDVVVGKL